MVVVWVARPFFLSTFVNRLLTQRIKFKLVQNFVRLLFLRIFDVMAEVKPSQIDWFFLVTWWWTCRVGQIWDGFQGVHVGDPVLHIVHAEPIVLSNCAFATQVACNTHIWCLLRDILSEDVFIWGSRRSTPHLDRSVRFKPDRRTFIFELRVKELKRRVCVVSWSLKASIGQKGEDLELLTNDKLSVIEV